jgi:2-amino-4-hydroxy-6-hydroxymethyldihydropteridine diphosphokinase
MNRVLIALGSNIDKEENLPLAMRLIGERCHLIAVSSVYETVPVGLVDQPNFLNAAVQIDTELSATQLKAEVLDLIEAKLKRRRSHDKNAARTIDVDIVLYNDEAFAYSHSDGRPRQVPDPDLLKFAHVAVPVAELASDMLHPITAEPLVAIARRLNLAAIDEHGHATVWKRPDITDTVKLLLSQPTDGQQKGSGG